MLAYACVRQHVQTSGCDGAAATFAYTVCSSILIQTEQRLLHLVEIIARLLSEARSCLLLRFLGRSSGRPKRARIPFRDSSAEMLEVSVVTLDAPDKPFPLGLQVCAAITSIFFRTEGVSVHAFNQLAIGTCSQTQHRDAASPKR